MKALSTAGISRASAEKRWLVIAVWIAFFALAGLSTSLWLDDALTTEQQPLSQPESVQGENLLAERMGFEEPVTETVVVTSGSVSLDDPAFEAVVNMVVGNLRGLEGYVQADGVANYYELIQSSDPAVAAQGAQLASADGTTILIPAPLVGELGDLADGYASYEEALASAETDAIQVLSVGDLSTSETFNTIAEEDLLRAEIIGIPIALIILILVFGALVAAFIPIILALAGIAIALGLVAFIGQFRDLSFFVTNMVTLIGLAVGIDYALFVIERYREERRHGRSKLDAIEEAGGTASKAVVFSGLTVVFALSGLFIVPDLIFRSLGLGAILVVLVAVAAVLTLVPAILVRSRRSDRLASPPQLR